MKQKAAISSLILVSSFVGTLLTGTLATANSAEKTAIAMACRNSILAENAAAASKDMTGGLPALDPSKVSTQVTFDTESAGGWGTISIAAHAGSNNENDFIIVCAGKQALESKRATICVRESEDTQMSYVNQFCEE